MRVEIDQSGKIEQLETPTVIVCANDATHAICINVPEKRKLFFRLRSSVVPKQDRPAILFAIIVFFLLRSLPSIPSVVIIDEEWTGKNRLISHVILKLIKRFLRLRRDVHIRFELIGKHSPAHRIAWDLHRHPRKRSSAGRVSAKDVLRLWQ